MRLVFAGTPEFAAAALDALVRAGHDIPLVLTQPDRPAGRGMKLLPSPVKAAALSHGLTVGQPKTLRDAAVQEDLAGVGADVMVVAAYGLILPKAVLEQPRLGCLNIHASLLPRWRGAAPIQRALLAGDRETGITIMQMDEGLDTGAMLMRQSTPVADTDTAQTLHDRLAEMGAQLIVEALDELAAGRLQAEPQDGSQATYAEKLRKEEAMLDWRRSATELERGVRAYNPFPVAQTAFRGEVLRLWSARPASGNGEPGEILRADRDGVLVACGEGALLLTELQRPGGKRLPVAAWLQGVRPEPGERLGA